MKSLPTVIALSVLAFLGSIFTVVKTDFFTSISELETLLRTEGELAKAINKYVKTEEQRLKKIERFGKEYQKMYDSAIGDAEAFLSHPVHAFVLLKHLTADWKTVMALIDDTQKIILDMVDGLTRLNLTIPGDEDLRGAAIALIRLQETYLLNASVIANGQVGETKSWKLSAGDCYEIGFQASEEGENEHCVLWMKEALKKLESESVPTANRLAALEMLALSSYWTGQVEEAKQITLGIIKENPNHKQANEFKELFDRYFKDMEDRFLPNIESKGNFQESGSPHNQIHPTNLYEEYEKLCRGEVQVREDQINLRCRYSSLNNSFLLLQPVKVEELSLDPRIVMYHDVISDHDIDVLKQLAKPELKRATVQTNTGYSRASDDRISQNTWFQDSDHPVVAKTTKRIEEITGLSASSAERLHVINYGIGGFYEPHYDFVTDGVSEVFAARGLGNRIATWMYYLSDVEAGGYTVFPTIGVRMKPRKGSAAFWFNLKRSGSGDFATMHAACPVLIGSKWVANKWFHETDNEFRRKCSLNRKE